VRESSPDWADNDDSITADWIFGQNLISLLKRED